MDDAREIYEKHLAHLTVMQRLRIAAFILNEISPVIPEIDMNRTYTDEEATDLAKFLMEHAGVHIPLTPKDKI